MAKTIVAAALAVLGLWGVLTVSAEEPGGLLEDGGVAPPPGGPPHDLGLDEGGSFCEPGVSDNGADEDAGGPSSVAPSSRSMGSLVGVPLAGIALAATGLAGVGTGMIGARWLRRPDTSLPVAAPEVDDEPTLDTLAKTVNDKPFDPLANYRLAVALYAEGSPDESVRHLDRALRLEPALIIHFLNDPAASDLRRRDDVHRMLQDHQRELNRKLWSGYA